MEGRIVHLAFLEGYLTGINAPERVFLALDALLAEDAIDQVKVEAKAQDAALEQPVGHVPEPAIPAAPEPSELSPVPEPKPRKRAAWTPEMRRAQAERMRAARRKGKLPASEPEPPASPASNMNSKPTGSKPGRNRSWGWSGNTPDSTPPMKGEITTYTDADGRKITKLPPGYARGISPTQVVMPRSGV